MGTQSGNLSGPDLSTGVPWSSLEDGVPLLGHAGGEAVVLVRRGEEVFATGATCTHYSGPLAEGVVVGDTIRCPWHHACFSLKTGEAIGAPALNDLPCWDTARDGALVKVGAKRGAPAKRAARVSPPSVVVVGAGAAGAAAVEMLRREGYGGPVTLVGAEPPGPVDRPNLSKDYLAGTAPEEWIPLRGADFYRELDVELVVDDPVRAIDRAGRRVTLASGRALPWGALILATGAEPVRLDLEGADRPEVHTLRTLADSRAIVARAAPGKRAVVIGASFIGLEVAAALRARDVDVEVVAPEATPLARVLGDEVGRFVRGLHEARGVRFHLGRRPVAILAGAVEIEGGLVLAADFVVMGVGVRPRVDLAQAAGLKIENGVVVDRFLQAAEGIWAAGDIARHPDPRTGELVRVEHWVAAERMGQAAARNVLGAQRPFRDVPFFWSAHYDVTLAYVGHATDWDEVEIDGSLEARDATVVYRREGRVLAVVTIGRDRVSLRAEAALERGDDQALEAALTATT